MAQSAAQQEWVTRVLGYRFPVGTGAKAMDLAPLRARWRQARAQVDRDLAAFGTALMANDAVKADPRFPFVRAAAAEIPNMLPAAGPQIDALLGAKDPPPGGIREALAAVDAYRGALDTTPALARLEAFAARHLKFRLALRATLAAAIDEIATTLRAAA